MESNVSKETKMSSFLHITNHVSCFYLKVCMHFKTFCTKLILTLSAFELVDMSVIATNLLELIYQSFNKLCDFKVYTVERVPGFI